MNCALFRHIAGPVRNFDIYPIMPLSWPELHGALTHIPVAFLVAVPVFEIGALLFNKAEWRIVGFWLLTGAVVVAIPTLITGWVTANILRYTGTPMPEEPIVVLHRLAAFTAAILAVILLLWRVHKRDQFSGSARYGPTAFSLLPALAVGYAGFLGGHMVFGGVPAEASPAPATIAAKPSAAVKLPTVSPQQVAAGAKLFVQLPCGSCHHMDGKGGVSGPDLTHEAQRHADIAWQIGHLKNPSKYKPDSGMPPFDDLPPTQLQALAAYLATRK